MSNAFIVLTGPPGIGKTTFVCKLVEYLKKEGGLEIKGFYTEEMRENGIRKGFNVVTIGDGKRATLSTTQICEQESKTLPKVGKYTVMVSSFEESVLPLFRKCECSSSSLLVIDEVGKMELFSHGFKRNVEKLLTDTQPSRPSLLITIPIAKGKPIPIVEKIRNHPMATVVSLNRSNRDHQSLFLELVNKLKPAD